MFIARDGETMRPKNDFTLLWFESMSEIVIHLRESSQAYCDSSTSESMRCTQDGGAMDHSYILVVAVGVVEKCKIACSSPAIEHLSSTTRLRTWTNIRLHAKPAQIPRLIACR